MVERTLVVINEEFIDMVLGKNTTLAYIAGALELGHEVYIHNLPKEGQVFPNSLNDSVNAIKIEPNSEQAIKIIESYKAKNRELAECVAKATNESNANLLQQVSEINPKGYDNIKISRLAETFVQEEITLRDVTNVLQRLEPMKAPFPPKGQESFGGSLHQIKTVFPHLSFNCPIYYEDGVPKLLIDKDTPQRMNEIMLEEGKEEIATPTKEFRLGDGADLIADCCEDMSEDYGVFFADKVNSTVNRKIILKPKNSAQALGVLAIEFCDAYNDAYNLERPEKEQQVYNLEKLRDATHKSLKEQQLYKVEAGLSEEELGKIVETLCYVESLKTNKENFEAKEGLKISDVSQEEQNQVARKLYDNEILAQPFLEGVKSGDIRVNIVKNEEGNFECAGITFRRSNHVTDDKFTTCLTTGGSSPFPIDLLTEAEQENLRDKIGLMCALLNDPKLKEKYKFSNEIGVDFLLQGDGKNVFLGEMNHTCPALIVISEIMNNIKKNEEGVYVFEESKENYDGGLLLVKKSIENQIEQRPRKTCSSGDVTNLSEEEKSEVMGL